MRLYVKLALATGVPFGVIMNITGRSAPAAVIDGVVFGILMSLVLRTLQLRADRKAEQRAAAARRIRMERRREMAISRTQTAEIPLPLAEAYQKCLGAAEPIPRASLKEQVVDWLTTPSSGAPAS